MWDLRFPIYKVALRLIYCPMVGCESCPVLPDSWWWLQSPPRLWVCSSLHGGPGRDSLPSPGKDSFSLPGRDSFSITREGQFPPHQGGPVSLHQGGTVSPYHGGTVTLYQGGPDPSTREDSSLYKGDQSPSRLCVCSGRRSRLQTAGCCFIVTVSMEQCSGRQRRVTGHNLRKQFSTDIGDTG